MNEPQMKDRTNHFALRILKMADALPTSRSGNAIADQLVRSGTSVAANYRAYAVQSRERISSIKRASLKKRLTKPASGLN
jgi:four helix bundle protein